MSVCIIPARGGSKRIPRKNIKEFNGRPMIAYSIEAALDSECFERVIISTDDLDIAEIAKSYGAEVPFLRPDELSNDHAGTLPVVKHAIEWLEQNGKIAEYVCCLYATAPFVKSQVIKDAFEKLKETQASYCFTVTHYSFPIQRAIKLTENNRVEMFYPEYFNVRSQDLEESYHDAGQFYWGKTTAFKREEMFFGDESVPFLLPSYLVQDIDTEEDWVKAELMYRILKMSDMI